jgi:hypothetical protein
MTLSYQYDPETNHVFGKAIGTVATRDILNLNYVENILEDKQIKKGFIQAF